MTDRAKKITELTAATGANTSAMIAVVIDPTGTPVTKKMSIGNFFGNTGANVVVSSSSPANSTALTVKQGTILFDANYLYVATANNVVKRVALESF